jgi:hypothetical protein
VSAGITFSDVLTAKNATWQLRRGGCAMRPVQSLFIAVLAPILANCSTHPLVDDVTRSTTFDVVEKIRCEAKRAVVSEARRFSDDTAIAYEFTFDIDEANDASGDVTWTLPLTAGSLSLRAQAGSDLERRAQRNFTIVDTFGDLRKADCSPEALEKNWIYPIVGEIGVYEVVATFAKLHRVENPTDQETFSFHDTLQFTTFLGAGIRPKLDLTPVTDSSLVRLARANLGAQRLDIHSVVIAVSGGRESATAVARTSVARSRSPGIRSFHAVRTNASVANAVVTNNTALSTTLLQTGGDPRQNAIRELDRARILALQERVRNQIVGP